MKFIYVLFFFMYSGPLVRGSVTKAVADLIKLQTIPGLSCDMIIIGLKPQVSTAIHYELTLQGINLSFIRIDSEVDFMAFRGIFLKYGRCVIGMIPLDHPFVQPLDKIILRFTYKYLILLGNDGNLALAAQMMSEKKIQTSNFVLVEKLSSNSSRINPVILHLGCPLSVRKLNIVDVWKPPTGYFRMPDLGINFIPKLCHANKSPLFGQPITVSVMGIPPYITFDPTTQKLGGIDMEIFKIVASKFRLNVTMKPEKTWLNKFENGTTFGTLSSVASGISDLGIGDIGVLSSRFTMVDYTVILYAMETGFVSRKPKPLERYKNIILPFDNFVWGCIAAASLAISITMFIIDWGASKKEETVQQPRTKALDIFLFPVAMLTNQGPPRWVVRYSKSFGSNFIVTFWLIGCTIFIFFYTCNLRASLVSIEREPPIDTSERVLEEGKPVYFPRGSYIDVALKTSPKPIHKKLNAMIEKMNAYIEYPGGSFPVSSMLKISVEGSGVATKDLYLEMLNLPLMRQNRTLGLHFSKEVFVLMNTGFVTPKHSYVKREVDPVLLALIDCGVMDKFFKALKNKADDDATLPENLKIGHFLSMIFFLSASISITIIIFICELKFGEKNKDIIDRSKFKLSRKTVYRGHY